MIDRPITLGLGAIAFAIGLAALSGYVALGLSETALVGVGSLSILVGSSAALSRRESRERVETPEPERRPTAPAPGASLSDALDPFLSPVGGASSQRLVRGLHGAAVAVLTRFEGHTEAEARRRIQAGTWTDDDRAASLLSSSVEAPSPPGRQLLVDLLPGRRTIEADVRHAVAAIASVGYGDRRERPRFGPDDEADVATRTTSDDVDDGSLRRERPTGHWVGVGTVALLAVGVGAVAGSAAVVLAGVVGVGYAGFARSGSCPSPKLSIDRTVDEPTPEPGETVDVSVTLTNDGDAFLPDLRFVDGVPAGLSVVDGSSRLATALRPGESVTLAYTVTARRGRHRFDPAMGIARDLSRSTERVCFLAAETELVTEPPARPLETPVALRRTAATFAGRLTTNEGGSGTDFHSVREYRRGDPLNRIDWNRRARTGELATLEFDEERATRVVVLVDARASAYLAPDEDADHAVDRSVDASARIAATLLGRSHAVGLAALGRDDARERHCWLAPASGDDQGRRVRELLATHPQLASEPPEETALWHSQFRRLRRRLPTECQVLFLTPLCDRYALETARRLDADGHPVTVVSPDPTTDRTAGQQLAQVARRVRRFDLQRAGVPVVDWRADESIDAAFARVNARGRQ